MDNSENRKSKEEINNEEDIMDKINNEEDIMDIKEEIMDIKGLHCKSCIDKIESSINSLSGVEDIKVSLAKNKAFVKFDSNKIGLDEIKSEISSLGYCTCDRQPCICQKQEKGNKNILQGIAYGLIPHIGCIAFIIGSILGVTVLMQFFKPLLMNRYFFYILILISLLFATLSSVLYLRKNGFLSLAGAKRKWRYLATMYGSTIGINLLLFMLIFPLLANVSANPSVTGAVIGVAGSNNGIAGNNNNFSTLKLSVDIPCPGHAPLISNELKSITGLIDVRFSFPNIFNVKYDSTKTSKQEILSLEVFRTYKATVLNSVQQDTDSVQQDTQSTNSRPTSQPTATGTSQPTAGGCGGGCGGQPTAIGTSQPTAGGCSGGCGGQPTATGTSQPTAGGCSGGYGGQPTATGTSQPTAGGCGGGCGGCGG